MIGDKLLISDEEDKSLCARAAAAGGATIKIDHIKAEKVLLGEPATKYVTSGLARIALGRYGSDYHGISQETTDRIVDDLYGGVDDLIKNLESTGYLKD